MLDWATGMLSINGTPKRPITGFTMGSGLGPAGSTLAAVRREIRGLDALPFSVKMTVERCVLKIRWMDDIWHVYPKVLSDKVKKAVKALSARDFYGSQLDLKITDDDVSFGFKFNVDKGIIEVEQGLTFRRNVIGELAPKLWPVIQGPQCFMPDPAKKGILSGHFIRLLDYTNKDVAEVQIKTDRLCRELRASGFSSSEISDAWARTLKMATRPLLLPTVPLTESPDQGLTSRITSDLKEDILSTLFGVRKEAARALAAVD